MIITCDACNQEYPAQPNLHERPAPAIGADVTEFVLICPHCQLEHHTHYTNPAIARRQELVRIATAKATERRTDAAWRRVKQAQDDLRREFEKLNPKAAK